MENPIDLECDLKNMRKYYGIGKTKERTWRESQLKGLRAFLMEKKVEIFKALKQNLGKHDVEAFRDEIGTLMKSLNFALKSWKEWMSTKKAKLPQMALLSSAEIVPEPLGVVLIISSWNFPFGLSLEPLIGAISAGNTMVLKPSELSSACSSPLATALPTYLDRKAIKVIQGGPDVAEQLLQQKWDKIFFTGSARVGRIVMSAAAKHLTPFTLELGGNCPALLDCLSTSWDREVAVKRIIVGKYGACAGQACIGIDYILAEKKFTPTLVELLISRPKNLQVDPKVNASIVYGGTMDEDNLFIEPTILVDPPLEAVIMTDEIFGPLLPIITLLLQLEKIEDGLEYINSRPKRFAIYAFTRNKTLQRRRISGTSPGSVR
ncbi:Aldehyde dehydrogenase [Quillaja saponaria]|uniref:Aldehyde dehydrogenase n=1 Tax=Quillaja saponaria TaxID=32244 RepID=A0AAD7VM69_QUISA|nr:Aldehyde dehydrogenase [Quillaja saponaria]